MLGPSESELIFVGARFPPCMKDVLDVPVTLNLACMNDTANPPDRVCPISDLCGFGGLHDDTPNQWFRSAAFPITTPTRTNCVVIDLSRLSSYMPASFISYWICLLKWLSRRKSSERWVRVVSFLFIFPQGYLGKYFEIKQFFRAD